jgi:hypothetical protein
VAAVSIISPSAASENLIAPVPLDNPLPLGSEAIKNSK